MLMDLIPSSKRHRLTNWIKKEDPTICCLQETHLIDRNKHRLRVKGWKKIYQANGPQKEARVTIHIVDKVDFKPTLIKQDKEGHSIVKKGEIHQKEIAIINLYAPNINAPNFIRHTLKDLKMYINSNTVVVGDFNSPPSPKDRSPKQNINSNILELNHTIDQMDLTDVYSIFHPISAQYTFFSAAHGTFSKTDHILGHKASLSKCKKNRNNTMHSI
jgi:exonuclease III